jgi:hypothetical protein
MMGGRARMVGLRSWIWRVMNDGWMGLAVRNPERDGEIDAGLATNVDISSFASAAITYIINGIFVSPFAPTTTFQKI